ncbi:MAG: sugar transferase [Nitrospira sp.]|nr:sugar transferase [Nitrospira sp.]
MTATLTDGRRAATHTSIHGKSFFEEMITRERKWTERSGMVMALLLISLPNRLSEGRTADSAIVANTLLAVTSELDILGWFEPSHVLGVIVPEITLANLTSRCDRLEAELRNAITLHGDQELAQHLSITMHVYPEPTISIEQQMPPSLNQLLYPELLINRRSIQNYQTLKRGIDIMLSAILLFLLLPVFALIAVLVRMSSPGPVFFKQTRVGHLMKPFTMYKFRTMHTAADHQVHHDYVSWFITASDQALSQQKPAVFKLTHDSRVTSIGRFLRRTSLDELPQLWNVLIGNMSLVGPRPPLPYEVQQYKPWHRRRVLEARPGITGIWQVVGRSRTTFDEMVRLDLQYTRTMSLWLDIKILLATPTAVITGKGAC